MTDILPAVVVEADAPQSEKLGSWEWSQSQEIAMRTMLDGYGAEMQTAMPGIVESFGTKQQGGNVVLTASVRVAIKARVLRGTTWESLELPLLDDVPVVFPSAGGASITLPLAQGDEVLVVFAARCIDAWFQSGGVQEQAAYRMHDLSDGFCIPGPRSLTRLLPSYSASTLQIRTDSGDTLIELDPSGEVITMRSPNPIVIDAPGIELAGYLHTTGNVHSDATVTGDADVVTGVISLKNHKTSGVTPGSGISSVPVP